jgi:aquaporin Z
MEFPLSKRLGAEFLGTFWLVFGGCGAAVYTASFVKGGQNTGLGIGFLGVALAFGLTVLTGAYAFGRVSGGHFNPAITLGLTLAKRFGWKQGRLNTGEIVAYIVTQVLAGIAAGALLLGIAKGVKGGYDVDKNGLAQNGYGVHSPGGYNLLSCLLIEVVLTAVFVWVILGATHVNSPAGFAPLAIGLTLTIIHLISIPITNTSVNPARSTGVALFAGNGAVGQLWLFWVAPILGGLIAGATFKLILGDEPQAPADPETAAAMQP